MAKNLLIIILIIFLIRFIYQFFFNNPPTSTIKLVIKNKTFDIEVARTVPQKEKGLMNRSTLCQNCGMIFISEFPMPQVFWMKNTLIPLDMVFLDGNGIVINFVTATPELGVSDNRLKLYQSNSPSQFVIELNAGEATKLSLTKGDKIDLPQF